MKNKINLKLIGVLVISVIFCGFVAIAFSQQIIGEPITQIGNHVISINDAINKIHQYNGKYNDPINFEQNISSTTGEAYVMASRNETYFVNQKTGNVQGAVYLNNASNSSIVSLSQNEALKIAQNYAIQHYCNATEFENMQLTTSELLDHGDSGKAYSFIWNEINNSAVTSSSVAIMVNPNTGKIISYNGLNAPVLVSTEPKITEANAVKIAVKYVNDIQSPNTKAELHVIGSDASTQKLVWQVLVQGNSTKNTTSSTIISVDAISGDILNVSDQM